MTTATATALFALLLATVSAQYGSDFTWLTGADATPNLCNKTFADANSSTTYSYDPGVPQVSNNYEVAKDVYAGVTVFSADGSTQWSLWYNTGGANYSNDLALGYDVCLFTIQVPTTNTFLRGQTDTGNCLATFDSDCNTALKDAANGLVLGLVNNATPSPNSNLTAGSLPKVCFDIGQTMTDNFPKECQKYFNGSAQVTGAALTSDESSGPVRCSLTDSSSNTTYEHLLTISGEESRLNYLTFNYFVAPFVLTWLPIANVNAPQSITTANSDMACIRAKHISSGSESVPAAPTPTPVGSGGGLSGGAIAGIVVGVVIGVAVVAGAAFWFWRRNKKFKKSKSTDPTDTPPAYFADAKEQRPPLAEAPPDSTVAELSPNHEVRPELPGEAKPGYAKPTNSQPAELLADVPRGSGPAAGR